LNFEPLRKEKIMLNRLFLLLLAFALCLSALVFSASQAQQAKEETARAQELLSQARAALGGDKFLKLQGFTANGNYRRLMGEMEISGELEINCLTPDKYLVTETFSPLPGAEITRIEAFNGGEVWSDAQSNGGPGMVLRLGGSRKPTPEEQARRDTAIRANLVRSMFTFVLNAPATFPLEYAYAGVAEAPEGKADMLDIKGPDKFALRLFLDQKTRRPLMMSYQERAQRMVVQRMEGDKPPTEAEIEKRRQQAEAEAAKQPLNEVQVSLGDYKAVDGVWFPHRVAKSVGGKTNEEWELTKFKVNPALKPEKFKK
jgi:hypothetical protein